jgi:demethylmenaquinone methyltransferase/2-methoxy-6-polyprenyl-1,4-benzoquinol methylase
VKNPPLEIQAPLDKSGASVRAMFSDIAGRYDFLNHLLSANRDKIWRRRAIKLLHPRAGERVLDLCCGTGDLAIECLRQQPDCEVLGADFATPMLQIATQKATLPFASADALRLPFRNDAFNALTVAFGARNFENTASGLQEMIRIVKPEGRVLVLEFMRPTSPLLVFGFGLFFKRILPIVGKWISRHCSAYNYLPSSVDEFYTRREFEKLMRVSGLRDVRSWNLDGGIATIFIGRKPN